MGLWQEADGYVRARLAQGSRRKEEGIIGPKPQQASLLNYQTVSGVLLDFTGSVKQRV